MEDNNDGDAPTANVYKCGECGDTLFVAEGRYRKFFGSWIVLQMSRVCR